jgi:hypothetical protein
METRMAPPNRFTISQWITPPLVIPALIVFAVFVAWLTT